MAAPGGLRAEAISLVPCQVYTVDDLDDPVRFPPDEGTYGMRDGSLLIFDVDALQ